MSHGPRISHRAICVISHCPRISHGPKCAISMTLGYCTNNSVRNIKTLTVHRRILGLKTAIWAISLVQNPYVFSKYKSYILHWLILCPVLLKIKDGKNTHVHSLPIRNSCRSAVIVTIILMICNKIVKSDYEGFRIWTLGMWWEEDKCILFFFSLFYFFLD